VAEEYHIDRDSVPGVLNMGLRDALYILENQGYKVKFTGKGRVVAQTPAPGAWAEKNSIINIQLSDNYETK